MMVPELTHVPNTGDNLYKYETMMLGHSIFCYMPNFHFEIVLATPMLDVRCHSHQLLSLLKQPAILPVNFDVEETCAQLEAAFIQRFTERCPMEVRQALGPDLKLRKEYHVRLTEDGIVSVTFPPPDNRPVYAEGDLMFELVTPDNEKVRAVYGNSRYRCIFKDTVPALSDLMETYPKVGIHRSFYPVRTVWTRKPRLSNSHLVMCNTWDAKVQVFFEVTHRVYKMRGVASDGSPIRIDSRTAQGLLQKVNQVQLHHPFLKYCDMTVSSETLHLLVQEAMEKYDIRAIDAAFDGKYGRVFGIAGEGSFGVVYKTVTPTGEVYAIKMERGLNLYRYPDHSAEGSPVPHYALSDDMSVASTVTLGSDMELTSTCGSTPRHTTQSSLITTTEVHVMSKLKGARHVLQLLDHHIATADTGSPSKKVKLNDNRPPSAIDCCFMVTPFYSMDLHDYLETQGPRDGFPVRRVIECLLNGLEEMERRSVAHLDIKAANVLVKLDRSTCQLEDVVYSDFGMGKAMGLNGLRELTSGPYCTWQGRPPELYGVGGFASCKADAFSVACMLYFVVTGHYVICDGLKDVIKFNMPADEMMQKRKNHFRTQLATFMVEDDGLEEFFNLWVAMLSYHERYRPSSATVARVFRERCTFYDEFVSEYVWPRDKDCDPEITVKLQQGTHWDAPFEYSFMESLLMEKNMARALEMLNTSVRKGRLVYRGEA